MTSTSSNSIISSTSSSNNSSSSNNQSIVWLSDGKFHKISKDANFVAENEAIIGATLNTFNHPNIVKYLEMKNVLSWIEFDQDYILADNEIPGKTCYRPVTVWEYIDDAVSLVKAVQNLSISDKAIASCICQTLFTIMEMQTKIGFVHGDLHAYNVMVAQTTIDNIKYNINNIEYSIDTFGYIIKIIDFGNSAVWLNGKSNYLTTPLYGIVAGESNVWFDCLYDLRIFLNACRFELFVNRKTEFVSAFSRFTANMFSQYDSDKNNGLVLPNDEDEDIYLVLNINIDYVNRHHLARDKKSRLVDEHNTITDILMALVEVPINFEKPMNSDERKSVQELFSKNGLFVKFLKSWVIVEKYFTYPQAALVLKNIVCFVKEHQHSDVSQIKIEGLFNAFIHDQMKSVGQKYVSIEMIHTSLLYQYLATIATPLKLFITKHLKNYLQEIKNANEMTLQILIASDPQSNPINTLCNILNYWLKNTV